MTKKIWFITGSSRGFGRIWSEAALKRGDLVAASARKVADLAPLKEHYGDAVLPVELDVTNADQAQRAVAQAYAHFGRLDVVLNNAGYSLVGTIEEASEADVRSVFDANFFGTLRVIQAALPLLRKQGSGHIVSVSSTLGIAAMPLIGFYCATKWAIEGLHESLAQEVKGFGIKVTLIEPGAYATDFGSSQSLKIAPGIDAYADLRQRVFGRLSTAERGDPQATPEAILKIVDAENPPLRFIVGSKGLPAARAAFADRLATWEAWKAISNSAQGEPKQGPIASGLSVPTASSGLSSAAPRDTVQDYDEVIKTPEELPKNSSFP
jgi:NAD(P)-dependent dehydrogenase (short-subunit alcohol dehydrogenase family)